MEETMQASTSIDVHITKEEEQIWLKLLPMFPDGCPDYLKRKCKGKRNTPAHIEEIVLDLIESDVPMRKVEPPPTEEPLDEEEQYLFMVSVLPEADPLYLRSNCHDMINTPEELRAFIDNSVESEDYPTKKGVLRKPKLPGRVEDYTTDFNVNKFLEIIPNPEEHFNDPKRVISYTIDCDIKIELTEMFRDLFTNLRVPDIYNAIEETALRNGNAAGYTTPTILGIYQRLSKMEDKLKRKRKPANDPDLWTGYTNIPMMQEIAYVTHMKEIHARVQENACKKKAEFEKAKKMGWVVTCDCCFDDEVLKEDSSRCMNLEHVFCNRCVIQGIEVGLGDGNTRFSCMASCDSEFSLKTLQKVLKPKIFSKLALRKQLDEIKQAGIEDLEGCPFCDFATIVQPDDKVFICLNDECLKESCRLCKEPSHIPYRCDEVEKPAEVQARVFIEDKMTEALLRSCSNCGLKFIKADGCNRMSCTSCGKYTCYVCRKPVDSTYNHFNGQGGSKTHLCPLYSDTEKLHLDDIRTNALKAKKEISQTNPNVELKHDPLAGLPEAPAIDRVYIPGPAVLNVEEVMD